MLSCLKLYEYCARRAASRAARTAEKSSAIIRPIMAMTTKSSIIVKPRLRGPIQERLILLSSDAVESRLDRLSASVFYKCNSLVAASRVVSRYVCVGRAFLPVWGVVAEIDKLGLRGRRGA